MGLGSAFAIYFLIWTVTFFMVLPFGVKTSEEAGQEIGKGHAESAPTHPMLLKKLLWNSVVAAIVFGILWLNYTFGWITPADLPQF